MFIYGFISLIQFVFYNFYIKMLLHEYEIIGKSAERLANENSLNMAFQYIPLMHRDSLLTHELAVEFFSTWLVK